MSPARRLVRAIDRQVRLGLAVFVEFWLAVFPTYTESLAAARASVALLALVALAAWVWALRRRRAIADTATSRIASAAQGYVELKGAGRPFDAGLPTVSPLSGLPCLWYRYTVERRDSEGRWHNESRAESEASFLIDDGSSRVVVDPAGAEVETRHKETWTQGDHRYTEWKLLAGDPIYAIGDFRTLGGGDAVLDGAADLKALLDDWKRDPAALRRRFDLDGNGEIDEREWALARRAARREVEQRHTEARAADAVHVLRAPDDARPYLIANLDERRLARRYLLWALFQLAVFFAALAALPWMTMNWAG